MERAVNHIRHRTGKSVVSRTECPAGGVAGVDRVGCVHGDSNAWAVCTRTRSKDRNAPSRMFVTANPRKSS